MPTHSVTTRRSHYSGKHRSPTIQTPCPLTSGFRSPPDCEAPSASRPVPPPNPHRSKPTLYRRVPLDGVPRLWKSRFGAAGKGGRPVLTPTVPPPTKGFLYGRDHSPVPGDPQPNPVFLSPDLPVSLPRTPFGVVVWRRRRESSTPRGRTEPSGALGAGHCRPLGDEDSWTPRDACTPSLLPPGSRDAPSPHFCAPPPPSTRPQRYCCSGHQAGTPGPSLPPRHRRARPPPPPGPEGPHQPLVGR